MADVNARIDGRRLHIVAPSRGPIVAAGAMGMGLFMAGFAYLKLAPGPDRTFYMAFAPVGFIAGLYFLFLKRELVLDAETRKLVAHVRWLFVDIHDTYDVQQQAFGVEHSKSSTSNTSDAVSRYTVVLGKRPLVTLGDQTAAEAIAKRLADHVGAKCKPTRDSKEYRKRLAWSRKYALLPLAFVVAALAVTFAIFAVSRLG